jgi:hypothetical protein
MFTRKNPGSLRELAALAGCVVLLVSMLFSSSSAYASKRVSHAPSVAKDSSPLRLVEESNTRDCPALPANFDPATASDQEISYYHLSPRPASGPTRTQWIQAHQHIQRIVCTHFVGRGLTSPSTETCNPPSGTVCTANWSGYYAGDGSQPGFNSVTGSWNVPEMNGSNSPPDSVYAIWVGLGGVDEGNLWQAGTGWTSKKGYYAWIEAVGPNGTSQQVTIANVHHNDAIKTTVYFNAAGTFYELKDNKTLYYGSAPANFVSGNLTAEWIDERDACGYQLFYKLADFQYSQWSSADATPFHAGAQPEPIGSFTHTRLWIGDNGINTTRLAWADHLGSNTGSGTDNFIDYWEDNGSSQCG